MAIKYEIKIGEFNYEYIEKTAEDGTISFIPIDPNNSDYQRYLRWLNNEPEFVQTIGEINE